MFITLTSSTCLVFPPRFPAERVRLMGEEKILKVKMKVNFLAGEWAVYMYRHASEITFVHILSCFFYPCMSSSRDDVPLSMGILFIFLLYLASAEKVELLLLASFFIF
ncbi:hypothetical protein Nepgr_029436 [Nepenthes gracilis]|uniref:Uncharacterized protein n=1 Tax=Nepenthes gracilis TaxID=150966 RepID=A0AAD3TE97_NEPGR|nr:hypothetical protein Nepgr_029436 [Nepenthes gracilis]